MSRLVFVIALLWLIAAASVRAQVVLDQIHMESGGNLFAFVLKTSEGDHISHAQTFRVGVAGTLDRVELRMRRNTQTVEPLIVEIRRTEGDAPVSDNSPGSLLGQVSIPSASVPVIDGNLVSANFTSFGILMNVGDVLAISLRTEDAHVNAYQWVGHSPGLYSRGHMFTRVSDAAPWMTDVDRDLKFQTFVRLPDPIGTSGIGLITGLLMLRRGRR